MELNKIHNMDCIEGMKKLPDNSVDAVVTDPPYGLGFMGKDWDKFKSGKQRFGGGGGAVKDGLFGRLTNKTNSMHQYGLKEKNEYQEFSQIWGKEVLRILKPGGFLVAFSGTRTYHRMVSGLEDAGFDIKDMINWIYGSGFPKSYDIGKGVDKVQGNKREVVGDSWNMPDLRDVGKKVKAIEGIHKMSFGLVENAERMVSKVTKGKTKWEGWGTALKPAHEPIVLAQKPREGTYADNVLKWDVGGLNIDESRINYQTEDEEKKAISMQDKPSQDIRKNSYNKQGIPNRDTNVRGDYSKGRFPSNVILECICDKVKDDIHTNPECPCYMLDKQSGISKSSVGKCEATMTEDNRWKDRKGISTPGHKVVWDGKGDEGGASRYFYVAKKSEEERTHEPIVLAQKPREGTYVDNALKWGVGGLNINESRIDFSSIDTDSRIGTDALSKASKESLFGEFSNIKDKHIKMYKEQGRFPSNVILQCICDEVIRGKPGEKVKTNRKKDKGQTWNKGNTGLRDNPSDFGGFKGEVGDIHTNPECPCYILDEQSGILGSNSIAQRKTPNTGGTGNVYQTSNDDVGNIVSKGDKGGASRFFYVAKAGKEERNVGLEHFEEKNLDVHDNPNRMFQKETGVEMDKSTRKPRKNIHPTVKPIVLMKYLVKLVSREGHVIVDPFLGSGTTAIACILSDRKYICYEKDEGYVRIAEARLKFWKKSEAFRDKFLESKKIFDKMPEDEKQLDLTDLK